MDNPAVIWGTRRISWGQIDQYAASVVSQLKNIGIKPGDRVAICAPSSPEYIIVLLSLWRMKAVVCPVSPRWPVALVNDYLSRIKAVLFLTTVQIKASLTGIGVRTLYLNEVVCFDARRELPQTQGAWQPDLEQEVTVIATAGSSGPPKPAVHTWGNHYFNALGSQEVIPLKTGDRWLLSLPLYHVSGMAIAVRCFLAKAAIVILTDNDLENAIVQRQVTHISLVSTQIYRLLQTPAGMEALRSLKYILLGGSAMVPWMVQKLLKEGLKVLTSYGLTEMASQVATGPAGQCVKILRHRQLKISGDGEILVKGETLFKGYIQSGRIHLPLTEDGWFQTGDLGQLDEKGCLIVLGRRDNMFISGGENVQPEEIEQVLLSVEGVAEAIVVPKEDAEFGHRPVAFVRYASAAIPTEAHIIKHCESFLPRFKIPVHFYPWPQDLIEKGLKISRHDLRGKLVR